MEDHWRELAPLLFKDPEFPGTRPTTAILIRARSVVQVHPGPPFKPMSQAAHTNKYAVILTFPLSWNLLQKPFCQPFVNFWKYQRPLLSGSLRQRDPYRVRLRLFLLVADCCPWLSWLALLLFLVLLVPFRLLLSLSPCFSCFFCCC